MKNRLRIKLAKALFSLSVWVAPAPEQTEEYKSLPDELKTPQDAVVDASEAPEQWAPEQHGNVVIVEPELITLDRRGKFK